MVFRRILSSPLLNLVAGALVVLCSNTATASPLKSRQVSLKDVETKPENFLGSRIVVDALIGSEIKGGEGFQELPVYHDAKLRANRLRFLVSKSLADQVVGLGGMRQATLAGTIAAPESVRAGYSFEVEEIVVKDAEGKTLATLKPAVIAEVKGDQPAPMPVNADQPAAAKTKPGEGSKKSDKVPTILVVVAIGLGVFLVIAAVVGMSLMKHLKKPSESQTAAKPQNRPTQSRIKISSDT